MTEQVNRFYGTTGYPALKLPCRCAAAANITLSGLQTVDGVAVAAGERVLVMGQTNAVDNGIYTAYTGVWVRTVDFDGPRDAVQGTHVFIVSGTTYGGGAFQVATADPVIGTTALSFTPSLNRETEAQKTAAAISAAACNSYFAYCADYAAAAAASAAGVNLPSLGTALQRLRVNAAGSALEYASPSPGEVVQSSFASVSTVVPSSAVIYADESIPQITEGAALIGPVSITPKYAGSYLRVTALVHIGGNSTLDAVLSLFKDSNAGAVSATRHDSAGTGGAEVVVVSLRYQVAAGSVSARSYSLRFGPDVPGTIYANGDSTGIAPLGAGMLVSSLLVEEIMG